MESIQDTAIPTGETDTQEGADMQLDTEQAVVAEAEQPDWMPAYVNLDGYETMRLAGVDYVRDPMSAAFVDLGEEELGMLRENIAAEGQKIPVVINEATGTVIDGWQRLRACQMAEMEPTVERLTVENPAAFVMAVNVHRRYSAQPTAGQRVLLAMELADIDRSRTGKKGRKPSAAKLAAAAGCSHGVVDHIRRAERYDAEHGTKFIASIRSGQTSSAAVNQTISELEAAETEDADAPPVTPEPEPKPKAEPAEPKASRQDLLDMIRGLEEDADIEREQHERDVTELKAERDKAAAEAAAAAERVSRLADEGGLARELEALTEQVEALRATLSGRESELRRVTGERNNATMKLAAAREALEDSDMEALAEALGVAIPTFTDDDDPFGGGY